MKFFLFNYNKYVNCFVVFREIIKENLMGFFGCYEGN